MTINQKVALILGIICVLSIGLMGEVLAGEAGENIGTYKFNTCIKLPQNCPTCSYSEISKIVNKVSGKEYAINQSMTKSGSYFEYVFCNTTELGDYQVNGHFDVEGVDTGFNYDFTVTPSGTGGSANIAFFILVILLIYAIAFTGLIMKNIPITIMGGGAMLFLGVYLFNNGVMIFRDDITRYLSYVTIAIGAILSIWASYEWYQDM